jgi:hypothetical protein
MIRTLTHISIALGMTIAIHVANAQEAKQNVDASQLLPSDTVLFVQVANLAELKEKFQETSFGEMLKDEELAPLLEGIYQAVDQEYEEYARDQVGIGLADLPNVIKGEVSFALAAPPREDLAMILIAEIGEENELVHALIEKGRERAIAGDFTESSEEIGQTKLQVLTGRQRLYFFEREGRFVFSNNETMIKSIIDRWDGNVDKRDRPLATNRKFMNVMERCNGTKEERPQLTFFIDPIELFRNVTRGNAMATVGLGMIRSLGADGLSAIGASMTFAPEDFDSLLQAHVLLANPRAGVIEMVAIKSGDVTPEKFVPYNVTNYMTTNWDVQKTYFELEKIYDSFRGEGKFAEDVGKLSEQAGVDIKTDVLDLLAGRFTLAQVYDEPAAINGQALLFAIRLNDSAEFEATIDKLLGKIAESEGGKNGLEENMEEKSFGGVKYRMFRGPDFEQMRERQREARAARAKERGEAPPRQFTNMQMRSPNPCFGIIDDYLVISDSEKLFKKAIETTKDDDRSLASDPDYARVMKEIRKQLDGKQPGLVTYTRPEESFRYIYDLAKSDTTRTILEERSEDDDARFLKSLKSAMDENELPEFEHFLKYMAPAGSVLINDESGLHYMAFSLKPIKK